MGVAEGTGMTGDKTQGAGDSRAMFIARRNVMCGAMTQAFCICCAIGVGEVLFDVLYANGVRTRDDVTGGAMVVVDDADVIEVRTELFPCRNWRQ